MHNLNIHETTNPGMCERMTQIILSASNVRPVPEAGSYGVVVNLHFSVALKLSLLKCFVLLFSLSLLNSSIHRQNYIYSGWVISPYTFSHLSHVGYRKQ